MKAVAEVEMKTTPTRTFSPYDLAAWTEGEWTRMPEEPLGVIQQDTRRMDSGEVYIALIGKNFDGHDFISQAKQAGASAAIVARSWGGGESCPLPCLRVGNTQQALSQAARGYRQQWTARVVGITGSAGKTTTKDFVGDLLKTLGLTCTTVGNYNNEIGVPLSLLAGRKDMEFGVYEMGMNTPGEIAPLAELVQPRAAIMTPVGLAHKESFGSEEDIAMEKSQLLHAVDPTGFSVLNKDLRWFDVLKEASAARVISVSLDVDIDADWHAIWRDSALVFLHHGREYLRCHPYWKPDFVVRTALQSIATAYEWGADPEDLIIPIESFTPSGRRWNQQEYKGAVYVDDTYNANPLSMIAALDALEKEDVPGRSWVVLGEMKELGEMSEDEHVKLGREVAVRSMNCLAFGKAGQWIADGFTQVSSMTECFHASAPGEAAEILRAEVKPGDGVLFKASRGVQLERVIERWVSGGSE